MSDCVEQCLTENLWGVLRNLLSQQTAPNRIAPHVLMDDFVSTFHHHGKWTHDLVSIKERSTCIDTPVVSKHVDPESAAPPLWRDAEKEQSGKTKLRPRRDETEVDQLSRRIELASTQPGLEEFIAPVAVEIRHPRAGNHLILDRTGSTLGDKPQQLTPDESSIRRTGAHEEPSVARLDPTAFKSQDAKTANGSPVDHERPRLDGNGRVGDSRDLLDAFLFCFAPIDSDDPRGPLRDPHEDRSTTSVRERND